MQDLTLVGLTEDKTKLVLVSDSGEEYTLPADAKLRAALRGDHARLGQLEIQMDSALRPRDIQARIRAGESPETVAQAAQTTVDRIMTYASPVLAERAHIADRAQRASVRRKAGEGPAKILGDAVAEQMRSKNVDPDSVEWDAWRRDDGRWTLVADFRIDQRPRHAVFIFDVQGRYVVAEDDESRWLVGEQPARKPQPRPAPASGRRLSAVSAEQELPLGDDAIEMVTGTGAEAGPDERTIDLTQTARELRSGAGTSGAAPGRADGSPAATSLTAAGDADWMATQASDRPATTARAAAVSREEHRTGDTDAAAVSGKEATDDAATGRAGTDPAVTSPVEQPDHVEEPAQAELEEPQPKKTRKGRRASVPSWDEIMFGGGRSD